VFGGGVEGCLWCGVGMCGEGEGVRERLGGREGGWFRRGRRL